MYSASQYDKELQLATCKNMLNCGTLNVSLKPQDLFLQMMFLL